MKRYWQKRKLNFYEESNVWHYFQNVGRSKKISLSKLLEIAEALNCVSYNIYDKDKYKNRIWASVDNLQLNRIKGFM